MVMHTRHDTDPDEPEPRGPGAGERLFQLLTLCFALAVALACTGEGWEFSTGSSGGTKKKKKKDDDKAALVAAPRVSATAPMERGEPDDPGRFGVPQPPGSAEDRGDDVAGR
jgi:hypothetical protein